MLQARQHCEIALINYRAAIRLDITGAGALLLWFPMLRQGSIAKEARQSIDDDKNIVVYGK